ncbi:hypothetical protein ACOSP7_023820 [Xanthoceras sorbifolium]
MLFQSASFLGLKLYTNADWASCVDDRRATSGCCVFLGPNLITWYSRKQKVVSKSSTEAEYRALSQAATKVLWLSELGIIIPIVPIIWCNNLGAGALAQNSVFHNRTKHIEVDVHFIREKIAAEKLVVQCLHSHAKG